MIEKFNFYDLYAYFLPGVILLALMIIPFALTVPFPSSIQSGVFALVLSYVFGYLVQSIARDLFPSKEEKNVIHLKSSLTKTTSAFHAS